MLAEAEEAKAFDEKELISNDPMTVVLSEKGWIRAAKGHDVDVEGLQYREGDSYLSSSFARNSQNAVLLDNFGKAYTYLFINYHLREAKATRFQERLMPNPEQPFPVCLQDLRKPWLS